MIKYGILALMCASLVEAKIAKIKNAELVTKGAHQAAKTPRGWKLKGEKKSVAIWNVGGSVGSVISLVKGADLATKLELAPLSDSEKKVKGTWTGLLMVDAYGCEKRGGGKFGVSIERDGKNLLKKVFQVRGVAAVSIADTTKRIKPQRSWIVLNSDIVDAMMSGSCTIKLTGLSQNAVVLGGVEVCRLHDKPTRRLEAKPNGQSGPDKVSVGSLGFNMLVEHQQRVSTVYDVRKGGIAEKSGLQNGDVIAAINGIPLGVNSANPGWKWFNEGHAATLGNAIIDGLEGDGATRFVKLSVFRKSGATVVTMPLPDVYLEKDFFLHEGKGGDKMRLDMIGYLVKNQKRDGSFGGAIRTTFAALSLLAEKDPQYAAQIHKAINWMLNRYPNAENFGNLGYWHGSYAGILYCEYYLATGDKRVLPRIQAIHDWVMTGVHTSKWGMACLGHGPNGLPYGNKALMAPTSHLLVFDGLAQKCGLQTQLWETLYPFMEYCWSDPAKGGHGSMGYNASYKDKAQFWSRTGQSALACAIRGEELEMQNAMTIFMEGNYPYYRNSHAYGEPGGAWGIISLALTRPEAYKKVMNALRWEYMLSWEPGFGMRFSQPHMGAPYMGTDDLVNAAYPLVFSAHKKSLFITGSREINWLDMSAFEAPLSEVILRQQRSGKVWLEGRIPGNKIVYTTDGSEPTLSSAQYKEPFDLQNGGVVKAAMVANGKLSKISERGYDPVNATLKVIAASGHKDAKEAVRRASLAIDGARYLAWIPDRGQDAKSYPHYVVFDLGAICKVSSLKFIQGKRNTGVANCKVYGSRDEADVILTEKTQPTLLGEGTWSTAENLCEVNMSKQMEVRYLRVEWTKPIVAAKNDFKIEELKIYSTVVEELPKQATNTDRLAAVPSEHSKPIDTNQKEAHVEKNAGASEHDDDSAPSVAKSENSWIHYSILGGLLLIVGMAYLRKK